LASKVLSQAQKVRAEKVFPPKRALNMRNLVIGLGAVVFAAGVFLWCGNVFRFFVTFPFAGYLTAIAGAAAFKAGKNMNS
jgi:Sec-independent protein secretion pathway component TatC